MWFMIFSSTGKHGARYNAKRTTDLFMNPGKQREDVSFIVCDERIKGHRYSVVLKVSDAPASLFQVHLDGQSGGTLKPA